MTLDMQTEIEALRAQLAEAEDMRRAIQRAEIDGFVVGYGDEHYVHLLGPSYARTLAERQRRHQESDERTRRFLGMLAIELLSMLKATQGSIESVKREKLSAQGRRAIDSAERHVATMQRLAEDLRSINPQD
jgi:hypothetical protein